MDKFGSATFCYASFLLFAPHWECPQYSGPPFSSCLVCDGWGSEQTSIQSRSMTNRKQGLYLSSNVEEPKVPSWQPGITANGSAQLPFSHWNSSCFGGRGSLSCSFASQTQPTPGRIAFSSILKRFALGFDWVWLMRFTPHVLSSEFTTSFMILSGREI